MLQKSTVRSLGPSRRPAKENDHERYANPHRLCRHRSEERQQAKWHPVGAIWPHENDNGFDLIIPAGISIAGRIVCVERKDEQPGE
jgi:hypothetical protein